MLESPDQSTLIVDPFPKPSVDGVGDHRINETRPFYESVLPQLVGMLVHRLVQDRLTDPIHSSEALTSFIAYCDSLHDVDGKRLGTDILLPKAQAIAEKVSEQLMYSVANSPGIWLAEVGFTQSRQATEQLRSLVSDPEIVGYVKSQGFQSVNAYAKLIIQDLASPKIPPERFSYSSEISSYTREQKIALLNEILRTYGHYDYGDITIPEVSLTVNARADLIHFACNPEDSEAQKVIDCLHEASKHHLHSIPLKNVLSATALIDTHFAKLKEAARLIIEGRIVCTFVEIKTRTSHPGTPKSIDFPASTQSPEITVSNAKSETDPSKMRDISHTVLAAVQVIAQLLSLADNSQSEKAPGSDFQIFTSLSQLLSRSYDEKIRLLRNVWPKLSPIVAKQQFIMVDVEWPVTSPHTLSKTASSRPLYAWDTNALTQLVPNIDLDNISHSAMSRWVMRHGAHLIERWLQTSTASPQETGITMEPIEEQTDEPPY